MQDSLGEITYEAYRDYSGGKSLVSGHPIPSFDKLPDTIKKAWEHASMQLVMNRKRAVELVFVRALGRSDCVIVSCYGCGLPLVIKSGDEPICTCCKASDKIDGQPSPGTKT